MTDSGNSATVLVVSQDPEIVEEARFGYPEDVEVEIATDARTAISTLRTMAPSVVVVDIQTGSAGGFSLAREMAQFDNLKSVPILMLLDRAQDEWLAEQAGADSIKVKPLDVGDLVATSLELAKSADKLRAPVFPR